MSLMLNDDDDIVLGTESLGDLESLQIKFMVMIKVKC